jgi:hypothetical protein
MAGQGIRSPIIAPVTYPTTIGASLVPEQ